MVPDDKLEIGANVDASTAAWISSTYSSNTKAVEHAVSVKVNKSEEWRVKSEEWRVKSEEWRVNTRWINSVNEEWRVKSEYALS